MLVSASASRRGKQTRNRPVVTADREEEGSTPSPGPPTMWGRGAETEVAEQVMDFENLVSTLARLALAHGESTDDLAQASLASVGRFLDCDEVSVSFTGSRGATMGGRRHTAWTGSSSGLLSGSEPHLERLWLCSEERGADVFHVSGPTRKGLSDRRPRWRGFLPLGMEAAVAAAVRNPAGSVVAVTWAATGRAGHRFDHQKVAALRLVATHLVQAADVSDTRLHAKIAFREAPHPIALWDPQLHLIDANLQWQELVGDDRPETANTDLHCPEIADHLLADLRSGTRDVVEQVRILHSPIAGELTVNQRAAAVRSEGGELLWIATHLVDVSTHYRDQERFRSLVETIPAAIVRLGRGHEVTFVNQRFVELIRGWHTGLLGLPLHEMIPEVPTEVGEQVDQVFRTGRSVEVAWQHRERVWLQSHLVPEFDVDGRIESVLIVSFDITEHRHNEELLTQQAGHDPLTGLANRLLLMRLINSELGRHESARLAVLYLDLDGFKAINDRHGHGVGDELLVVIGERIRSQIRHEDLAARLGGDEFVVVMSGPATEAEARSLAERLMDTVARPIRLGDLDLVVSVSVGVGMSRPGDHATELLQRADKRMYEAKAENRNHRPPATAVVPEPGSEGGTGRGRIMRRDY